MIVLQTVAMVIVHTTKPTKPALKIVLQIVEMGIVIQKQKPLQTALQIVPLSVEMDNVHITKLPPTAQKTVVLSLVEEFLLQESLMTPKQQ